MLLSLVQAAFAGPLLIRFADPDSRATPPLSGVVRAGELSASFSPLDGGSPPDVHAGDGVFTVVVEAPEAERLELTLSDSAGGTWSASIARPSGLQPDLDLLVDSGAQLSAYTPTVPGGDQEGFSGEARPAAEFGQSALPWGVALVGWGVAVALVVRERRRGLPALAPGRRSELAAGLIVVDEPVEALLARLTQAHRVLVLGPAPAGEFVEGDVFLMPGSAPRIGDIAEMVDGLRGRGRPLVVLALAWPERLEGVGEQALTDLAAMLRDVPVVVRRA